MKLKLISLIMAIATLLTLAACGNDEVKNNDDGANESPVVESSSPETSEDSSVIDNSDNSNVSDESSESIPEKETFPFAGTWNEVQYNANPQEDYVVFDENGDCKVYRDVNSDSSPYVVEYELIDELDDFTWGDNIELRYKRYYSVSIMKFTFMGNHYSIRFHDSDRSYSYYYREEDLTDYDVVELTAENVTQYIEEVYVLTPKTNGYGEIYNLEARIIVKFKDGLGAASFILAELNYNTVYKSATYNAETGKIILGEAFETYESKKTYDASFCAGGTISTSYQHWSERYTVNDDGTYFIKSVELHEFTGAEKIIGKVYVPKDWNK